MTLQLTVMGCSGTLPGPERACSSYLVEADGYRLLLDCGNGSLTNLRRRIDLAQLDGVLLSHLHPDHCADIYGLYYGLRLHRDGPATVPLYGPPGADEHLSQLLDSREIFSEILPFTAVVAGDKLELGPLHIKLFAANHPVEAVATRIEADGRVLTYTGDSALSPVLYDAGRDADLLIADSTWLERNGPHPANVHMTGAEAGAAAAAAGAKALMVSHVFPDNDPVEIASEAAGKYGGKILIASDLQQLLL